MAPRDGARSLSIDLLKAIAIYLVVWGHMIQYLSGGTGFFEDVAFRTIYAFHMPLFMTVSGWVFYYSFEKNSLRDAVSKRLQTLVLPAACWSVVGNVVAGGLSNGSAGMIRAAYRFSVADAYGAFWFVTVLFLITVGFSTVMKGIPRRRSAALVALWIILLALPDTLLLGFVKYMYPYFLLGYFANEHRIALLRHRILLGMASTAFFVVLVANWQLEHYIYVSGMSLWTGSITERLSIIAYRYAAGAAGTGMVMFAIGLFKGTIARSPFLRWLAKSGQSTLGIYLLSSILFTHLISRLGAPAALEFGRSLYDMVLTPSLALALMILCNACIALIDKSRPLGICLLGRGQGPPRSAESLAVP